MSINYDKQEEECLALSYAFKILKAGFEEVPEIQGIIYVDWVPEVVRTLIKTQIDFRQVQIRICAVSKATWLTIENIRKLMKNYTISELEKFEKVDWKVVFHDFVKVEKSE